LYDDNSECKYCQRWFTDAASLKIHRDGHPTEIIPSRIWLGSEINARSLDDIKHMGIACILNVAEESMPLGAPGIDVLHLKLKDVEQQDITSSFEQVSE
jgi:hypothetical protein